MTTEHQELQRIRDAYGRRKPISCPDYVRYVREERESHYRLLLGRLGKDLHEVSLIELGCGQGGELERLIALGLTPKQVTGVELLSARVERAREALPAEVRVIQGDATACPFPDSAFRVVFISTVFSSILDPAFRWRLGQEAWRLVAPGGAVMVYDFCIGNPRNPDVCGIPRSEIVRLFPDAEHEFHRVTLAPPIGRAIAPLGGRVYRLASAIPLLRTHVIGWLRKA